MGEIDTATQDSPQTNGQASDGGKESTSEQTRTYTEQEVQALLEKTKSDTLADVGRKYKPLEEENATLKSQLATNLSSIKRNEELIAKIEQERDELSKDDPDKLRLTQRLRDIENEQAKLRDEKQAIEKDRAEVSQFMLAKTCNDIAAEFQNTDGTAIDSTRLVNLAVNLRDQSPDAIRQVASTLWNKKPVQTETPKPPEVPKPDSGVTSGGTSDEAIRKAYRENPNDPKAYKDYQDYLARQRGF